MKFMAFVESVSDSISITRASKHHETMSADMGYLNG